MSRDRQRSNRPTHLDLRSHVLFVDDYFEADKHGQAENWETVYLHERNHWIRFQGSTIGLFMHLLRFAQDWYAVQTLPFLDAAGRERVDRRRKEGRSLWSFDEGYTTEIGGNVFGLCGESWLDMDFSRRALFDIEEVLPHSRRVPANDAIRNAICDSWAVAHRLLPNVVPYPGFQDASQLFAGPIEVHTPSQHGSITTRTLWESASMMDEARLAAGSLGRPRNEAALQRINEELAKSPNAAPWRFASKLCANDITPRLFLMLVDFATNPPLHAFDSFAGRLTWAEFYPPLRFEAACRFVARHSYRRQLGSTRADVNQFRRDLELGTSMRYGLDQAWKSHPDWLGFALDHAVLPYSFTASVLLGSRELLNCKYEEPERVFAPKLDSFWPVPRGEDLEAAFEREMLLTPFIADYRDGIVTANGFDDVRTDRYLRSCRLSGELTHLVSGKGALDLSYLPNAYRGEREPYLTWHMVDSWRN